MSAQENDEETVYVDCSRYCGTRTCEDAEEGSQPCDEGGGTGTSEENDEQETLEMMQALGLPTGFRADKPNRHKPGLQWFNDEIQGVKQYQQQARKQQLERERFRMFADVMDEDGLFYPARILQEISPPPLAGLQGSYKWFQVCFVGHQRDKAVSRCFMRPLSEEFKPYVKKYLESMQAGEKSASDPLTLWKEKHYQFSNFDVFASNIKENTTDYDIGNASPEHDISKYWSKRFTLWSRFNWGIQMDNEGWYSVTPEALAAYIASRCPKGPVIDAFAGVGGNSIQFALAGHSVTAIEIDETRCTMMERNASIYEASDKITICHRDFFGWAREHQPITGTLFLAPPWGGPEYTRKEHFSVRADIDIDGIDGAVLLERALQWSRRVIYYLPKNTDVNELCHVLRMACNLIHIRWSEHHIYESEEPSAVLMYLGIKEKTKALLADIRLCSWNERQS
eukprot:gb/GECG01002549.1/.p1 GENE.gb/GECG01002549.1/~~gb/GECG01002549.1/.p1  ORF type:complete len:453 (+),score=58.86 gb/GECG01002549.1/:1-1359(+)